MILISGPLIPYMAVVSSCSVIKHMQTRLTVSQQHQLEIDWFLSIMYQLKRFIFPHK